MEQHSHYKNMPTLGQQMAICVLEKVLKAMEWDDALGAFGDGERFQLCLNSREMGMLRDAIRHMRLDLAETLKAPELANLFCYGEPAKPCASTGINSDEEIRFIDPQGGPDLLNEVHQKCVEAGRDEEFHFIKLENA